MNNDIKEIFDIWADEDGEIVVHYIDKNNNKQEYKMIESLVRSCHKAIYQLPY